MSHPTVKNWVGGAAVDSPAATIDVLNPATAAVVAQVEFADHALVERTVEIAKAAARPWGRLPASRRAQVMFAFRDLLAANVETIAQTITREHGKTLDDARGEIIRALDSVQLACAAPTLIKGEAADQAGPGVDTYAVNHPVGVGVGITPFNFPAMIPLTMACTAMVMGNAFILKPSEQDPSVTLILADLAKKAGIPDGIFSVIHGGADIAEALITHPDVAAVSFVGSTPVAHAVYRAGAAAGIRVQALGGAKNHLVVAPDANLEETADAISSAAFGSAGQRCMAITVAVAVGEVADPLVALLKERAERIVVGDGSQQGVDVGPLINADARDRVQGFVRGAIEAGATAAFDESEVKVDGSPDGFFVGPVLLDSVTPDMEVYQQELFGPVLVIVRVDTLDEGLGLIRTSPYGNGAAIFTQSGSVARYFQREADAGQIGVNVPIPVPIAAFGTSGWKGSLFGSAGLNAASVAFWTKPKYITTRWDEPVNGVDLGFRPN
jgi:malonate-semialdehyde dehydrogenase (acetylating)/methylmalonate-semialdehyde dehydrogenase